VLPVVLPLLIYPPGQTTPAYCQRLFKEAFIFHLQKYYIKISFEDVLIMMIVALIRFKFKSELNLLFVS
jgi:hypothetical protein